MVRTEAVDHRGTKAKRKGLDREIQSVYAQACNNVGGCLCPFGGCRAEDAAVQPHRQRLSGGEDEEGGYGPRAANEDEWFSPAPTTIACLAEHCDDWRPDETCQRPRQHKDGHLGVGYPEGGQVRLPGWLSALHKSQCAALCEVTHDAIHLLDRPSKLEAVVHVWLAAAATC